MKLFNYMVASLVCAWLALSGCASAKANSQKTLAGIQYAKDAAMKTWGAYVAKEQRRCDALPDGERQLAHARLLEKRLEIDAALRKFSAAWMLAWTAANYDTDKPATGQLSEAISQLQFAVAAFTK